MTDAATPKATLNKFEKLKAEKDGLAVKAQIEDYASIGWEVYGKDALTKRYFNQSSDAGTG